MADWRYYLGQNHDVVEFQETDVSQSQIHLLVLGPAVVARDNENEMFFLACGSKRATDLLLLWDMAVSRQHG